MITRIEIYVVIQGIDVLIFYSLYLFFQEKVRSNKFVKRVIRIRSCFLNKILLYVKPYSNSKVLVYRILVYFVEQGTAAVRTTVFEITL